LGSNQRSVPGCDWRYNTNAYCHSDDNTNSDSDSYGNINTKDDADTKSHAGS
jgi:hypothetical protein